MRTPITWRTLAFSASLVAVAAAGYAFTSAAHAERSRSQDPSTWTDSRGEIDESRIPDRIAMSTGDVASGVVYIDPHKFYGQLGARTDEGPVPVYDQRDGGDQVGTYDLRTGEITIDLQHSRHPEGSGSAKRPRTTVAMLPVNDPPQDSSPPTTATGDTTDVTPNTDPAVTVGADVTGSTQP